MNLTSSIIKSIFVIIGLFSISLVYAESGETQIHYSNFESCSALENTLQALQSQNSVGHYELSSLKSIDTITALPTMTEGSLAPSVRMVSDQVSPKSDTNIQVQGIDESDSVKTDGKHLYVYNEKTSSIVILDAKNLTKIKSIKIPLQYTNPQFYIQKNTLIITATKFNQISTFANQWFDGYQKTVVMIYDISYPSHVKLTRSIEMNGILKDSRLDETGILTAVVTTSYGYRSLYSKKSILSEGVLPIQKDILPNIVDMRYVLGKPTISRKVVQNCTNVKTLLPDPKSLLQYQGYPTLTSIIRFDVHNSKKNINTEMILGDAGQIHVSARSIYLTSHAWTPTISACPVNARCIMPRIFMPDTNNTLIHRFDISNANIRYKYSTMIPGLPLNQYSMDENHEGNFRIITSESNWTQGVNNSSTRLSVISPEGKTIGKITGIAPGETFQSSRFIGNRLYLVTFEQIDPFFVISLADSEKPTVLGELKIPGYSTYLHPYDENRLIGIGYDTKTNQWGGVQNAGIKIDLYNVSDVKNPKQEQSLVLGDVGSSSDALFDPKAFTWYKEKKLLLMSSLLMTGSNDATASNIAKSAFQGVVGVSIDPQLIREQFRVTHMLPDQELMLLRDQECQSYTTLPRWNYEGNYIPEYCKKGTTLDMYLSQAIWNHYSHFIKRVLYVGENLYTIGDSKIQMQKFSSPGIPIAGYAFQRK